jgi:predicted RNA binding protein YcfA (HicA-like mRNA interferase family)
MAKALVISAKDFIKFLNYIGFEHTRTNGSHYRFKHADGRVTTVPVHKNLDLPKGLLRKIIKEDLDLDQEQFDKLWKAFSKK